MTNAKRALGGTDASGTYLLQTRVCSAVCYDAVPYAYYDILDFTF